VGGVWARLHLSVVSLHIPLAAVHQPAESANVGGCDSDEPAVMLANVDRARPAGTVDARAVDDADLRACSGVKARARLVPPGFPPSSLTSFIVSYLSKYTRVLEPARRPITP
jgi:hypothetical protein